MLKGYISLIILSFLLSASDFQEYIYDVEIKGISMIAGTVGKCVLKIEKIENNEYQIDILTKTTNLAKILYPYVDKIKLKVDNSFSLISMNQKISNKKEKTKIEVDKTEKIIKRNGRKLNFYSDSLFSPYSLIPLLRTKDLKINNEYFYEIFSSKKIKDILLKVLKSEEIKVPYGTFDCLNIKPITAQNAIKNNGELELWYTNDSNKIPIKIKLETKIGTFIMKLREINN
ncbi:MAG: hypothetical protein CMG47_03145 [Candidatus Marinimicrobia bacterium]|nr:hypothetical protein [Candidatus Neomarinimicrobiota bacterium]